MAFNKKFFQPLGGSAASGGFLGTKPRNVKAYWTYGSDDSMATIKAAGYFNEVRDLVNPNDAIIYEDGAAEITWGSFLAVPKTPLTTNVTLSALNKAGN